MLLLSGTAWGWVETHVLSHRAVVRVGSDGSATVEQELRLKIRGGPVQFYDIPGVSGPIEPLPDARIQFVGSGSLWPLELKPAEDGTLRLVIGHEKGVRGGTYLATFSYKVGTLLGAPGSAPPGRVRLRWVGPRLRNGVDGAQVTFVLPHTDVAPELPVDESSPVQPTLAQVRDGQFYEVDLVRAHVATGEPAVWELDVDQALSGALGPSELAPTGPGATARPSVPVRGSLAPWAALWGGGLFVFGWLRERQLRAAGRALGVRVRPLLAFPGPVRLGLLGLSIGGVAAAAALGQSLAALLGTGWLALLVAFWSPAREIRPRGPGEWRLVPADLTDESGWNGGRWLDPLDPRGGGMFLALVCLAGLGALRRLTVAPTEAFLCLGALVPVLPLFWTSRPSDFPQSPLAQGRRWHRYLARAFRKRPLALELWGRFPAGTPNLLASQLDETRVRVVLNPSPRGLRALEIGLEEAGGRALAPCVLVRVLDDSPAMASLSDYQGWTRGRAPHEKVLILRPRSATPAAVAELARQVAQKFQNSSPSPSGKSARKSGGTGDLTGSPLSHAT
jgi:hypothetical protein